MRLTGCNRGFYSSASGPTPVANRETFGFEQLLYNKSCYVEAAHSKKSKERQNIDFNLFFHNCLSVSFSTTDGLLDQCAVDGLRSPKRYAANASA